MLKKNDICNVLIKDIGHKAEGIGKVDDFVLFVENTLPGDECSVKALKVKKSYGYAKVLKIIKPSGLRVEPTCPVFSKCGGCSLMHMDYKAQLEFKRKKIVDALERLGGIKNPNVNPVIPSDKLTAYRNKAQIPVKEENGEIKIGYYAKNSHRVVENPLCEIQNPVSADIIKALKSYMVSNNIKAWNEENNTGLIRHLLIRNGQNTGELMVCLIINGKFGFMPKNISELTEDLAQIPGLKSISLNYNTRNDNVIMGDKCKTIWGSDYITDKMGDFSFRISALSFYQVNSAQALKMYEKAVEFAKVTEKDTVVDAYSGIGTVASFMAKKAEKVYGIEIIPQAVLDAEVNAGINGLSNTAFLTGKSEEVLFSLMEKGIKPDIIVLDPPRKGCEAPVIEAIIKALPQAVVYISCNPDTLARDAKALCGEGYKLVELQPYDMFAHSVHVESVALFSKL